MNREIVKALAYFLAANTQAVIFILAAYFLVPILEENYPLPYSWGFMVWPLCIVFVSHTYYVVMRRVLQIEKTLKDKKDKDK